ARVLHHPDPLPEVVEEPVQPALGERLAPVVGDRDAPPPGREDPAGVRRARREGDEVGGACDLVAALPGDDRLRERGGAVGGVRDVLAGAGEDAAGEGVAGGHLVEPLVAGPVVDLLPSRPPVDGAARGGAGVPDEGVGAEGEDGVVERGEVLEADPPSGEPEREVEAERAVGGGPERAVVGEGEVVQVEAAVADALPGEPLPRQREVLRGDGGSERKRRPGEDDGEDPPPGHRTSHHTAKLPPPPQAGERGGGWGSPRAAWVNHRAGRGNRCGGRGNGCAGRGRPLQGGETVVQAGEVVAQGGETIMQPGETGV